jgi:hypothetical protein
MHGTRVKITYTYHVLYFYTNEEHKDLYSTPNILSGHIIENNEMGGACSAHEGGERHVHGFGGETCGKEAIGETQV